jgi:hypothetical protein
MEPMKDSKPTKDTEENDSSGGVDEGYIEDASAAVASLSPEDFKSMPGLKVPTDADDGEEVQVIITGTAKDGFLTDVMGAECDPGTDDEEAEGEGPKKGRIRIMIDGGDNKEEGQ